MPRQKLPFPVRLADGAGTGAEAAAVMPHYDAWPEALSRSSPSRRRAAMRCWASTRRRRSSAATAHGRSRAVAASRCGGVGAGSAIARATRSGSELAPPRLAAAPGRGVALSVPLASREAAGMPPSGIFRRPDDAPDASERRPERGLEPRVRGQAPRGCVRRRVHPMHRGAGEDRAGAHERGNGSAKSVGAQAAAMDGWGAAGVGPRSRLRSSDVVARAPSWGSGLSRA